MSDFPSGDSSPYSLSPSRKSHLLGSAFEAIPHLAPADPSPLLLRTLASPPVSEKGQDRLL